MNNMNDNLDNRPIKNPNSPDREDAADLIEALSSVIDSRYSSDSIKKYAQNLIDRVKAGYEKQSGEKYDLD